MNDNYYLETHNKFISDDIKIYYNYVTSDVNEIQTSVFPLHWHPYFELIYVQEGILNLYTKNGIYKISAGECAVINKGELHHGYISGIDFLKYTAVLINPALCESVVSGEIYVDYIEPFFENKYEYPVHISPCKDDMGQWDSVCVSRICGIMSYLKNKAKFDTERTHETIHTKYYSINHLSGIDLYEVAYSILSVILQLNKSEQKITADTSSSKNNEMIKKIIIYINGNYGSHIYLKDLAAMAYMSEDNFGKSFKSATGSSPIEYLTSVRVKKAAEMITSTPDKTIMDILVKCGFNHPSYFSRMFKKYMGCTPSEFKLRQKKTLRYFNYTNFLTAEDLK